jgi:hypothetical protein
VASAARYLVIGDSHTAFFSGRAAFVPPHPEGPFEHGAFEVAHVGPGLAASLVERESQNRTRAKALEVLEARNPADYAGVILCFGEIDCRFHIVRRAQRSPLPAPAALARSIDVTAHRYLSFIAELAMRGWRPVVFGPVASSVATWPEPYEWPTLGTVEERNALTQRFSERIASGCGAVGADYVSLIESLVDDTGRTREELYFDGVHLGPQAWPLFRAAWSRAMPGRTLGDPA